MITGIAVMLLAAACGTCLWRMRRYRSWLRSSPRRSDSVTFRNAQCVSTQILDRDGWNVPRGIDLLGRTVLLRVAVKATLLGHWRDPFIEIGDGERTYRQYFERGAAGGRYLNLTPVFRPGNRPSVTRVFLRGSDIHWEREVRLLAFDPPPIEGATLLVLAPHPDDAEIASFGMYANCHSWVVTITAGEKATGQLPADIATPGRSRWAGWLRVWDSLSVPSLGDVPAERRLNLAYPDGALASMYREPARGFQLACEDDLSRAQLRSRNRLPGYQNVSADCTWSGLVEELRGLLELIQPDIVVCPHPVLDSHSDHVFTTIALGSALREFRGRHPQVFLYVVHSGTSPLYPLGPAQSLVCLPPGASTESVADSLYSHSLEPAAQQAKYFAVEAMHAARRHRGDAEPKDGKSLLRSIGRHITAYLSGMALHPESLLRRGPRPNEMYYIIGGDTLSQLVRQVCP